jgi:pentatricopeptide repeat protein
MLVAYNALLHFLGSLGELQRSLGVYRGMARVGPRPDVVTYNTLIAAAAGGGNVRVAMQVFSDMVDAGGCCSAICWAAVMVFWLICACDSAAAPARARHLSTACLSETHLLPPAPLACPPAEVEPTERTCGALLNCYAKARDAASARKVFDSMAQLGIAPNLTIYTSLIDACVQAGDEQYMQVGVLGAGQYKLVVAGCWERQLLAWAPALCGALCAAVLPSQRVASRPQTFSANNPHVLSSLPLCFPPAAGL